MKRTILSIIFSFTLLYINAQTLVDAVFIENLSQNELAAEYGVPAFLTNNGVNIYKVRYNTPNIEGDMHIASGLVVIPDAPAIYPLLCYQHGTVGSREDVPSNVEGDPLGVVYSAFGYVTASADYIGLGDSPGTHTYVHAETAASAAIDLLFAARELMAQEDQESELNDQLFIAGYSQGGHAAAAAHREIQENYSEDFTVTASAPMSGPYSISGAMRDLILDDSEYFSTAYIPNTMLSYNAVYNIADETEDFFKPAYAEKVDLFAAEEITLWELEVELQTLLMANEGGSFPKRMLQDTLITAIESNPNHPINIALADNDVFDWTPAAPTRLYYCMADDQVPFMNSLIAEEAMNNNGASDVDALDLNSDLTHTQCVNPAVTNSVSFFQGFQEIGELTNTDEVVLPLKDLQISPNPAHSETVISWSTNTEHKTGFVSLYSAEGKLLGQQSASNRETVTLQVDNLNQGMYWVVVRLGNEKGVKALYKK